MYVLLLWEVYINDGFGHYSVYLSKLNHLKYQLLYQIIGLPEPT